MYGPQYQHATGTKLGEARVSEGDEGKVRKRGVARRRVWRLCVHTYPYTKLSLSSTARRATTPNVLRATLFHIFAGNMALHGR